MAKWKESTADEILRVNNDRLSTSNDRLVFHASFRMYRWASRFNRHRSSLPTGNLPRHYRKGLQKMNDTTKFYPLKIYRRPLTSVFVTFDGSPMEFDSDDELRKNYRYSSSTFS